MDEVIGWASSAILVLTISAQLHKQWKSGTSKGVSKWLFIGQFAASVGFVTYSWRIGNWVFVATNALLGCEALLGLGMVLVHRRKQRREGARTGSHGTHDEARSLDVTTLRSSSPAELVKYR
jgi:MtN3 and saliva related transmembrane protein